MHVGLWYVNTKVRNWLESQYHQNGIRNNANVEKIVISRSLGSVDWTVLHAMEQLISVQRHGEEKTNKLVLAVSANVLKVVCFYLCPKWGWKKVYWTEIKELYHRRKNKTKSLVVLKHSGFSCRLWCSMVEHGQRWLIFCLQWSGDQELEKVLSFKPGARRNTTSRASLVARNSVFLVHATSFSPVLLKHKKCRVS